MAFDDICFCPKCGRGHRHSGFTHKAEELHRCGPGDILQWGEGEYAHRWRVLSVCLGALGQESLIEVENVSHKPGKYTVGGAGMGAHTIEEKTMFIPECLTRSLKVVTETAES